MLTCFYRASALFDQIKNKQIPFSLTVTDHETQEVKKLEISVDDLFNLKTTNNISLQIFIDNYTGEHSLDEYRKVWHKNFNTLKNQRIDFIYCSSEEKLTGKWYSSIDESIDETQNNSYLTAVINYFKWSFQTLSRSFLTLFHRN